MFQTPNRTEPDQERQKPKPNINRTGPIANIRNRNRTEAETTLRFTTFRCKKYKYRARSRNSKKSLRNHSPAICRYWIAKYNSNSIAQRQQQEIKSHLEISITVRAQFETDSTPKRRRPKQSRKRANFSPQRNVRLIAKTQCFRQILIFNRILASIVSWM